MKPTRHLLTLAAAAMALGATVPAQAMRYSFSQTGFADGATVSGWFSGRDDDGDGVLLAIELSGFELHFSGNRAVEAFSQGMDNRAGFVFDIASQTLQHMVSNGPDDSRALEYDAFGWPGFDIPGRVSDHRSGLSSITWERLQLSPMAPVPEPQTALMLAAGLGALGRLARRRLPPAQGPAAA